MTLLSQDEQPYLEFKINTPEATRSIEQSIYHPAPELEDQKSALQTFESLTGPRWEVMGVPFGGPIQGRDSDGEAFTAETDIAMLPMEVTRVTFFHGFNINGEGMQQPVEWIGRAQLIGLGEMMGDNGELITGHIYEVRTLERHPMVERLTKPCPDRKECLIKASSGAVGHLTRRSRTQRGLIEQWPIGELAIFDVTERMQPANDYAVVRRLKGRIEKAEFSRSQLLVTELVKLRLGLLVEKGQQPK